jgi:hypothetical protein
MEVLLAICQEFSDQLVNGLARTIPRVDPVEAFLTQLGDNPLLMGNTEQAQSTGLVMSAMMAVLKVYYSCKESYVSAMLALQRAQAAQRKLQGYVRCTEERLEIPKLT